MKDLLARTPLRVRLVALMLVLVALALGATAVGGTYALRDYLTDKVDTQQLKPALMPAGYCGDPPSDSGRGAPHAAGGYGRPQTSGFFTLCRDDAGTVIYKSIERKNGDVVQSEPDLSNLSNAELAAYGSTPFTVPAQGAGYDWRVLVGENRNGDLVAVAVSLDDVQSTVGQLILLEIIISAGVLVLLGLLAYVLVRSSLRPLVAVEHTAEAIAAGDLTRRVPEADPRTEVGGLAKALNVMLGQIETAFDERRASEAAALTSEARMRRFIADASHELRTPLTSIRGFAELYRQGGGADPEVAKIIGRIERHATRMGVLVDDLLLLARLDQQRPLERHPVDLLALATDAIMDARVTAPDHMLRLRTGGAGDDEDVEAAVVLGDEVRLRQVLGNLVTNALMHTPAGTEVTVYVGTEDGHAILEVADNGPGMSADDAERVFERFYRTDPSRTRAHGGTGLGLSIVAALVAAHGGDVTVQTSQGQGATFRVRLPLAR
jgi:two-component system, OmpR family, sensor kinase